MMALHDGFKIGRGNVIDFLAPITVEEEDALEGEDENDGPIMPKRRNEGKKYKDEHLQIFSKAGLMWPPDVGLAEEINHAGLSQRQSEQTFYLHMQYKETASKHKAGSVQFFDANYSLKRNISWCEKTETATVRDPWKELLPGITTKSVMVARFLKASSNEIDAVRVVSGHELMLFIGWPRQRLSEILQIGNSTLTECAGGAFSGFSLLPILSIALYGAGKIGVTGDAEQVLQDHCTPAAHEIMTSNKLEVDDTDTSVKGNASSSTAGPSTHAANADSNSSD